ncbi:uncharacterized protein LOC116337314 [Contarinia nasturtii]|uniref:uncharacterized protein LOC116337314 n=1 Tax=Contarinia nasturtii TaxID=265458 RepID=UPI0012D37456|nr:uncharacterized protein LOC116337314 [Contarinia nasturtii]
MQKGDKHCEMFSLYYLKLIIVDGLMPDQSLGNIDNELVENQEALIQHFRQNLRELIYNNIGDVEQASVSEHDPDAAAIAYKVNYALREIQNPRKQLTDITVDFIATLYAKNSTYEPQTSLIFKECVTSHPCDGTKNDVQILYGEKHHWICTFWNAKQRQIVVYDSLYNWFKATFFGLSNQQEDVLKRLYHGGRQSPK